MKKQTVSFAVPARNGKTVLPSLFGQNLEHTRSCIAGGLSAQVLRNRKFYGKPSHDGLAAEWEAFGNGIFCELPQDYSYTRHDLDSCRGMDRRNELNRQFIMHVKEEGFAGIVQKNIPLMQKKYLFRIALHDRNQSCGKIRMEFRSSGKTFASFETSLSGAEWETRDFSFVSPGNADAELYIGLTGKGSISIGMVSLLPEDHWHGMRMDVVEHLREIGTTVIRWPGGNFAGEYRWRDGLLPVDERAPSQSAMEFETQPYTCGYDNNELGTDDIAALCRYIGAEPFFTINAVWETPESSAAWVEYCNGPADSPMGKIRAERGFPEPFNVKFWSLGNEMGFAHMEGTNKPEEYAGMVSAHGRAMKAVSPEITLCSSGPLPDEEWERCATAPLAEIAPVASFHHYMSSDWDFSSPERLEKRFSEMLTFNHDFIEKRLADMCRFMPETVAVSFDEWNWWYTWFRKISPLDGVMCGHFLHWLLRNFRKYRIGSACYFQPVNEHAIDVTPRSSSLTAIGQAMQMMCGHIGGEIISLEDCGMFATKHEDGSVYLTLLNTSFHEPSVKTFDCGLKHALATVFRSRDILPGNVFEVESTAYENLREITIEPLSLVSVRFQ